MSGPVISSPCLLLLTSAISGCVFVSVCMCVYLRVCEHMFLAMPNFIIGTWSDGTARASEVRRLGSTTNCHRTTGLPFPPLHDLVITFAKNVLQNCSLLNKNSVLIP